MNDLALLEAMAEVAAALYYLAVAVTAATVSLLALVIAVLRRGK